MESKKEIKTYKKRAVVAMLNEYKQLHNLDVFGTQDATINNYANSASNAMFGDVASSRGI